MMGHLFEEVIITYCLINQTSIAKAHGLCYRAVGDSGSDHGRDRTCNLLLRRQPPYPLSHAAPENHLQTRGIKQESGSPTRGVTWCPNSTWAQN